VLGPTVEAEMKALLTKTLLCDQAKVSAEFLQTATHECPASVDCARVVEFNVLQVYIKKGLTSWNV
jgi:hypothetical protein